MKTAITITVRMKSTRLPLKVLRLINKKPMIEQLVDRLKEAQLPDFIILCTSTNPQDEILVDYAQKFSIRWFKGEENDVLKRLFDAAMANSVDFIVSTTADNPLTDPIYIDKIIEKYRETGADFITVPDLPLGCFSYGLKVEAIKTVLAQKKEEDTEIWGMYFKDSEKFKKEIIEVEDELRKPRYRFTVDTPEDLELIRKIYKELQIEGQVFPLYKVVQLIKKSPKLLEINKSVNQRTVTTYTKIK